jgi:hypothetical protein
MDSYLNAKSRSDSWVLSNTDFLVYDPWADVQEKSESIYKDILDAEEMGGKGSMYYLRETVKEKLQFWKMLRSQEWEVRRQPSDQRMDAIMAPIAPAATMVEAERGDNQVTSIFGKSSRLKHETQFS